MPMLTWLNGSPGHKNSHARPATLIASMTRFDASPAALPDSAFLIGHVFAQLPQWLNREINTLDKGMGNFTALFGFGGWEQFSNGAYTGVMNRWRSILSVVIALWLPLQGYAAVAMPFCQHRMAAGLGPRRKVSVIPIIMPDGHSHDG